MLHALSVQTTYGRGKMIVSEIDIQPNLRYQPEHCHTQRKDLARERERRKIWNWHRKHDALKQQMTFLTSPSRSRSLEVLLAKSKL